MKTIKVVFFSPAGGTKKITTSIAGGLDGVKEYHSLMDRRLEKKLTIASDEALLLVMPVYSNRIPEYCVNSIKHIHGKDRPAIIVCVYGNRDYGSALPEMEDLLSSQGLDVVAAGAFIAQHSLFPEIAKGRPDEKDLLAARDFAAECNKKLAAFDHAAYEMLKVPGEMPLPEYSKRTLVPAASSKCTKCRTCVEICPVHAISREKPKKVDEAKCIGCCACVAHCPTGARGFSGLVYGSVAKKIGKLAADRRDPEVFI